MTMTGQGNFKTDGAAASFWQCAGRRLDLTRPLIMGILNATPDSFSDGGEHFEFSRARDWGEKLLEDGADILDIGGESTRPGSQRVPTVEELRRVLALVEYFAGRGALVSVDTSSPEVMREALQAGAAILNDVRAFEAPGALETAAGSEAGLVIMHGARKAGLMPQAAVDHDETPVVDRVERYLLSRQQALMDKGAARERICWDPGFGFGKSVEENFALLAASARLARSGQPLMAAISRKSSLGAVTGIAEPAQRATASVAGAVIALERGARIVRVHDVRQTREARDVWMAVQRAARDRGEAIGAL